MSRDRNLCPMCRGNGVMPIFSNYETLRIVGTRICCSCDGTGYAAQNPVVQPSGEEGKKDAEKL